MDSSCFSLNGFRRRGHSIKNNGPSPGFPEAICRRFSFAEMKRATEGFHHDKLVGEGGFSKVYKGCLDDDRTTLVAIKRRNPYSRQGLSEFMKEVELCCQLRHQNLLPFKGFCKDQDEMILVYEYIPNGSLDRHLFHKARKTLPWSRRLQICIDAARALHYLHSGAKQTIIHCHVTARNILLGQNWEARLSDLGFSKVSKALTTFESRIIGTYGYMAPEYAIAGELTEKADIYSFGVVLLEVLSGRMVNDLIGWFGECQQNGTIDQIVERPDLIESVSECQQNGTMDEIVDPCVEVLSSSSVSDFGFQGLNLMEWVSEYQKNGTMDEIVDPCVKGQIAPKCLRRFVEIAERCMHEDRMERPSMGEVQVELEDALELQQTADSLTV